MMADDAIEREFSDAQHAYHEAQNALAAATDDDRDSLHDAYELAYERLERATSAGDGAQPDTSSTDSS